MRMKLLRSLLLLLMIFSLFTVTAHAEEATVTGTEVNVRTGPGTSYPIFETLKHGMTVSVMNRTNADWYLVSWDGNSGYVFSQFLQITKEDRAAEITVSQDGSPGYINAMYVCLRSGPGTNCTILGTYSNGKTLTITGSSGAWTAVTIDGKDGFVFSDFVSAGSVSAAVVEQEEFKGEAVKTAGNGEDLPVVIIGSDSGSQPASAEDMPVAGAYASAANAAASDVALQIESDSPAGSQKNVAVPESGAGASSANVGNATISGNSVRFRTGPNTTYSIIDTYDSGKVVTVTGQSGDWAAVTIDGVSGYVHSDYVRQTASGGNNGVGNSADAQVPSAESKPDTSIDGYITASNVRLRESASMSSRILTELSFGTSVKILSQSGDWTKVNRSGQVGYVSSSFVTEGIYEPAVSVTSAKGAALGKEIAEYALQYVGFSYNWGGNSPATGFDCSGFVQYVFAHFGYTTSRVANDVTKDGVHVDPSDLQVGDVLCFYSSSNYVGHVGIYIGDNSFVHAANSASGVVTTSLSSGYYATRGYEIRRII